MYKIKYQNNQKKNMNDGKNSELLYKAGRRWSLCLLGDLINLGNADSFPLILITLMTSYFHYRPKIPVDPKASFVQTAKEELDDSAVLNYLTALLIQWAYWLLADLSSILTRENGLLLANIEERDKTATPSNSAEEKTQGLWC